MRYPILFVLFMIGSYSHSQDEHPMTPKNYISLSAGLQSADFGRPLIGLSFRHAISENWWFKTGITYNGFQGDILMNEQLLYADSSTQIYRDQYQYNKSFLLSSGVQYYPIPYLNIGMDVVVGYSRDHISLRDRGKSYDSLSGVWFWDRNALPDRYPDLLINNYQDHSSTNNINGNYSLYLGHANYLVTGGTLSLGGRLPIAQRWEVGLTYATSFLRYTYLNNNSLATSLNYEGKTVYPGIQNYVQEPPSFNLWNHSLSLSAGFGF